MRLNVSRQVFEALDKVDAAHAKFEKDVRRLKVALCIMLAGVVLAFVGTVLTFIARLSN